MLFSLLGLPYAWSARRRHWQRGTGSDNGNGNAPDRKQRIGVSSDSDPNQPHYEFQGPPGAIVLLVSLPLVIAGLYFGCNGDRCVSLNPLSDEFLGGLTLDTLLTTPLTFVDAQRFFFTYLWSVDTWLIYLCWFFGHVLLYFILPGRVVEGVTLDAAGTKLKYPLNGKHTHAHTHGKGTHTAARTYTHDWASRSQTTMRLRVELALLTSIPSISPSHRSALDVRQYVGRDRPRLLRCHLADTGL